jgi:hypothetical protein
VSTIWENIFSLTLDFSNLNNFIVSQKLKQSKLTNPTSIRHFLPTNQKENTMINFQIIPHPNKELQNLYKYIYYLEELERKGVVSHKAHWDSEAITVQGDLQICYLVLHNKLKHVWRNSESFSLVLTEE